MPKVEININDDIYSSISNDDIYSSICKDDVYSSISNKTESPDQKWNHISLVWAISYHTLYSLVYVIFATLVD